MPLEKAFITLAESPEREAVPALFNPPDYTVTKSNHFARIAVPGLEAQLLQFVRGENRTIQVELFFDTTEERMLSRQTPGRTDRGSDESTSGGRKFSAGTDVREITGQLLKFMEINPKTHTPPVCLFGWGKGQTIRCVIESATQKFTRFLENGTPVRATLGLTLREIISASTKVQRKAEQDRDSPAREARTWVVKKGDTLWAISGKEYGDPRKWKRIASANGIEDPRRVRVGTVLVIPEG